MNIQTNYLHQLFALKEKASIFAAQLRKTMMTQ